MKYWRKAVGNKMKLKNKLKIAGLAGLLSVLPAKDKATHQEAKEVLNVRNDGMIRSLPNGYKTSRNIEWTIKVLAGVYNGGVEVIKEEDGNTIEYLATGTYSQFQDPKSYEKVLKNADVNKDKIITRQEARDLEKKVYEEYAKEK